MLYFLLFPDEFQNGKEKWENLRDSEVCFNYLSENQSSFCIQDVAYINKNLDIILLELSEPSRLPPELKLYPYEIPVIENVDIIGYGHPADTNMRFDHTCKIIDPRDSKMQDALKWMQGSKESLKKLLKEGVSPNIIDWGFNGYDRADKMIFSCYLEKGSSGGPVFANKCFGGPVVVGVVTEGLPRFFWDLNYAGKLRVPNDCRFEMGTRMQHIFQELQVTNRDLVHDLFEEDFKM